MREGKIFDYIVVDEPKNVEIAVFNLTGQKVEFELIRKFIYNEKNTIFYIDRKMNSSTNADGPMDYVWLDTGFRDYHNNPIMICLKNGVSGYIGHYTGTIKELFRYIKESNKKNANNIDRNYARFIQKYKNKVKERETVYISDSQKYAVISANYDSVEGQETAIAAAIKLAGIKIGENVEEPVIREADNSEEELTESQKEITMGILFEQIESMQAYIDKLLSRIENQEKTSKTEIANLKSQNQEYKRALVQMRSFNAENECKKEQTKEELAMGHSLLGKNEKILILGNTDIREAEMKAIARDYYGFEKSDFEFITDYEKIKSAGSRLYGSSRYVAVIFGNCPHKVANMGNYNSIIDEFKQRRVCPISIDARTVAGGLKITKQSFTSALTHVYKELKNLQVA